MIALIVFAFFKKKKLIFQLLSIPQNKIAKDADALKFEEEDLILKVGECLEARILSLLYLKFIITLKVK